MAGGRCWPRQGRGTPRGSCALRLLAITRRPPAPRARTPLPAARRHPASPCRQCWWLRSRRATRWLDSKACPAHICSCTGRHPLAGQQRLTSSAVSCISLVTSALQTHVSLLHFFKAFLFQTGEVPLEGAAVHSAGHSAKQLRWEHTREQAGTQEQRGAGGKAVHPGAAVQQRVGNIQACAMEQAEICWGAVKPARHKCHWQVLESWEWYRQGAALRRHAVVQVCGTYRARRERQRWRVACVQPNPTGGQGMHAQQLLVRGSNGAVLVEKAERQKTEPDDAFVHSHLERLLLRRS